MLKQFITVFFCFFLIVSCNYFDKYSNPEHIKKIDTIVNFNSVDAFPLFPNCKEIPSREKQQVCFQLEMSKHIYGLLKQYSFNSKEILSDTVLVKLKVDALGKISLSKLEMPVKTKQLIPEFDSILKLSLQELPIIEPAIKRAMPVTTEFTLPIVLKN